MHISKDSVVVVLRQDLMQTQMAPKSLYVANNEPALLILLLRCAGILGVFH